MQKGYTIKIDGIGTPEVEAHGFTGGQCEEATRGVTEALGAGSVEHKDEFYENEEEQLTEGI